ncbi:hypothetical protein HAX54_002796, partial [Datura stramonium]|nr:hypothetical protein [Datura stramonium]
MIGHIGRLYELVMGKIEGCDDRPSNCGLYELATCHMFMNYFICCEDRGVLEDLM